jgi:hypothetical protein
VRRLLITCIILVLLGWNILAQSKSELEEQRKRTIEEITYVDNI